VRICKVWDADYPWDVRTAKVCRSLTAAGHEVHLVARNKAGRPVREQLPEATVHRLRPWPIGAKLSAATMFPAFFNPRWGAAILHTARTERCDLILVRDLPLAPTAIAVGRMLGVPVVLDMAENYPAMMRSLYENNVQKPWDFLVRNPAATAAIERWTLRHIDHVVVVVEESRDRLVALGYPADRVTVVCNTPPLERLATTAVHAHKPGPLHLNYLGLLEAPRGLGIVIDALARSVGRKSPVFLTVIGSGRERNTFEAQARRLGLGPDAIKFLGYVQNAEALRLVAEADVGLVPHQATESWNTTIPNKLFDYMAGGLAIITSDARPAARIVSETRTGGVYHWADADALSTAFDRMLDPAYRSQCGQNGRAAVQDHYNWDADTVRLLAALDRTVQAHRR
jgi:glycosyltransferase involved in cell wall biosynthesis